MSFFFSLLTSSYLPPLSLFADFPPFNYLSICTGIRRNQCLLSVLLVLLFTLNKNIGVRSLYINGVVVLLIQQVSFVLTHAFYLSTSQEEEQIICFIFEHWMIFYFKYRRAFWYNAPSPGKRSLLSSISSSIKTHSEKQSFHPVCSSFFLTVVCNLIQREVFVVWKRKNQQSSTKCSADSGFYFSLEWFPLL